MSRTRSATVRRGLQRLAWSAPVWLALVCGTSLASPAAEQATAGEAAAQAPATQQAWLGLSIEKGQRGVRVIAVMPQSPCAAADVQVGDEVLSIGAAPKATAMTQVTEPAQLIAMVRAAGVGAQVNLSVLSPQGQQRKLSVTLGPMPKMEDLQRNVLLDKRAPDFVPKVLSGQAMTSLTALRGQVVLLDFFASWCGPCMRALPEIGALHQRLGAHGLRVLGVSSESEAAIRRVIGQHKPPYTVAMDLDGTASRAYSVFALPTLVVIDRKGVVRAVVLADVDQATRQIEAALSEAP